MWLISHETLWNCFRQWIYWMKLWPLRMAWSSWNINVWRSRKIIQTKHLKHSVAQKQVCVPWRLHPADHVMSLIAPTPRLSPLPPHVIPSTTPIPTISQVYPSHIDGTSSSKTGNHFSFRLNWLLENLSVDSHVLQESHSQAASMLSNSFLWVLHIGCHNFVSTMWKMTIKCGEAPL